MAIEKGIAHRPGLFKQTNKEHKHGRHRSKGSISSSAKGTRTLYLNISLHKFLL